MKRSLDATLIVLTTTIFLILALGGVDYDIAGLHLRLHDLTRPALLLVVALVVRARLGGVTPGGIASGGLLAIVLAAAATYATYQVRVCGGLDSYGYVSTSALIASGHLSEPQPLASLLPFDDASNAAAPLGYVAGIRPATQVPRFPLGLPLVMAAFRVFGPIGPFFVPLLMAFVTFGLAFALIGQAGGAMRVPVGLFAAAVIAVAPLMVDYGIQPMSDVPAACWLLASLWLRLDEPKKARPLVVDPSLWSGVCAGMALLTRPALLAGIVTIGIVGLDRPFKETLRFAAALICFVAAQAALNVVMYGSAGTSGYGPASYMFELSGTRLTANASNFAKWVTYSHTPLIWLLWPLSIIVLRDRRWMWKLSAVAATSALPYLFYLVFDDWESVRFILPTILLVLIMAAAALGDVIARVTSTTLRPAGCLLLFVIALACAAASNRFLTNEGVYRFGDLEAKYRLAGEWVETHTPERAVVLAALHSGSLRYYGHRPTIRWDQIPSDKLTPTLRNLEAAGYVPYLALDTASEPPLFAERFAADSSIQTEPIGRVRVVNIYRFVDRPR